MVYFLKINSHFTKWEIGRVYKGQILWSMDLWHPHFKLIGVEHSAAEGWLWPPECRIKSLWRQTRSLLQRIGSCSCCPTEERKNSKMFWSCFYCCTQCLHLSKCLTLSNIYEKEFQGYLILDCREMGLSSIIIELKQINVWTRDSL